MYTDAAEELRDLIAAQEAEAKRGALQSSEFEGMASLDKVRRREDSGDSTTLYDVAGVDPTDAIIEALDGDVDPLDAVAPDTDPRWFGRMSSHRVWDERLIVATTGGDGGQEHEFRWQPQFRQQYGGSSRKRGKPTQSATRDHPVPFTHKVVACMAGGRTLEDFLRVVSQRGPTPVANRGWKEMVALTVQMLRAAGWSVQSISEALGLSKQRISTLERHELPILSAAAERLGWTSSDAVSPVPVSGSDAAAARSDDLAARPIVASRRLPSTIPDAREEVSIDDSAVQSTDHACS